MPRSGWQRHRRRSVQKFLRRYASEPFTSGFWYSLLACKNWATDGLIGHHQPCLCISGWAVRATLGVPRNQGRLSTRSQPPGGTASVPPPTIHVFFDLPTKNRKWEKLGKELNCGAFTPWNEEGRSVTWPECQLHYSSLPPLVELSLFIVFSF